LAASISNAGAAASISATLPAHVRASTRTDSESEEDGSSQSDACDPYCGFPASRR
jgi:hypothetical protein